MPYTPTEWGNKNPKLTPELMNHLENGIAELESSTNASISELENSISELQSSTNASVTELENSDAAMNTQIKANKDDIAALDDYIKEGGMSNFTTLMTLGAVNDGITDNTEVVKKAVQYCKEKNKDLYIEQGTYLIKDRIIIDFPLRIQGSNIDNTKLLFELPEPSTETKYDDTYWEESNSAFIIKSDNAAISNLTIQNKNLEDRRWNGIIFHYPKTKDDGSKFYASSERCELSSLNIRNFKSGIFIYGGWSRNISMSKILDCTYGIKYEALENINWSTSGDMISNCYIVGSKEYGLYANKTFETSVEGVIFEYNKVPIYCANALDTIFINCWNEANTNGIEIDGNAKFVNGYNITNETVHQTENGIVFIEKPNDIMALRANEVVFHQVDGIIVKGVSLGSKTINLIKNSSFGTIADKNFNSWTVDAQSITTISNTETYKNNNSVFFDFHEGWASDPFYGITTDAISIPKGDYKFSFAFKSPDRSTIDNKAKYLIMKLNSEGTVVDYLANEDFLPNGNNVWEIVSKAISITDETASIKIKIQVNRNGLLYISTPVFADADISSDSLSLKDSGVEGIITVVNQNGTEVNQIYTASKITSLETDVTEINSNLDGLEFGEVAGGKNLLNPDKTIIGELMEGIVSSGKHYISDYISIKSDTSYSISNCTQSTNEIAWYTSDKTYISRSFGTPVVSPSNASYVRIEYIDNINAQLEEGTTATDYEPYIPSVKMLAEEVNQQNESLAVIGKCKNLLNPTLQTTTQNGVTCTNNGDGTYTLNGTATAETTFIVQIIGNIIEKHANKDLWLVGCPKNGSMNTYRQHFWAEGQEMMFDTGSGTKFRIENTTKNANIAIIIEAGVSVDNIVFKPMVTTNLDATYDDFVPYSGDGDTLTADVANQRRTLSNFSTDLNNKLKAYTIWYKVPPNTGGWHKIAQTTSDYFNFDLYVTGGWYEQPKSNAHFQIQNTNGIVRIVQLSGITGLNRGISKIRMVRVVDDVNTWILEEYSPSTLNYDEYFRFIIAGNVTVTPLDGSVDASTDFKSSVSLDVSDIPTGAVIVTGRKESTVIGKCSTAVNYNTTASGDYSHAEGRETTASGEASHAEGYDATASGRESHAEGCHSTASGDYSHAEGNSTSATQSASHAEGCATTASGDYSHAEGYGPTASGYCSHAEGNVTMASGDYSHAEGRETTASVDCSHAEGRGTIASGWNQHVQGKYNEADTSGKYAHIIGGGADDSNRKNIHTVDWEGNAEYAGNVTSTDSSGNKTSLNDLVTGIDLRNTSGHVTKAHVDFLNVGGQKIVLQGSVSGAAGDFFSVSKNDSVNFDLKVDNTFVVPEPVTKLLYSSQGDFRSTVVGTITITHGTWSDGTKSISINIIFNNNYNFTSAAVRSGIVYFQF